MTKRKKSHPSLESWQSQAQAKARRVRPDPGPALTELCAREVGKDAEGAGLACPWPWSPIFGILHQPLLAGIRDQLSEQLSMGRAELRTSGSVGTRGCPSQGVMCMGYGDS